MINTIFASNIEEASLELNRLEEEIDSVAYELRCYQCEAWRLEEVEPSWTYAESMRYIELVAHIDELCEKLAPLKHREAHLAKLLRLLKKAEKELWWLEEEEG